MTAISIPSSVISIKKGAFFSSCNSLTSIIAANPIPIDLTSSVNVFDDINKSTCILYVPVGSKSAYQSAQEWKDFTRIVEDPTIPTGLESITNEKQLNAYPNPTSGKLKLVLGKTPQHGTYLTVVEVTGKVILKQLIQNKEEWIDLKGNPPGVYLIMTNLKDVKVQRILLQ